MLIDFNAIPETVIPNMRGGEKEARMRMHTDPLCKVVQGRLIPGASIGLHTHEVDSETIYILSGEGKVLYNGEYEKVGPGSCHYCPNGHSHSLINDGEEDLLFFAVIPVHKEAK